MSTPAKHEEDTLKAQSKMDKCLIGVVAFNLKSLDQDLIGAVSTPAGPVNRGVGPAWTRARLLRETWVSYVEECRKAGKAPNMQIMGTLSFVEHYVVLENLDREAR